ncbi:addiction module protein [Azonexus hydrophilus]|uniref:addiction module protein n=1 Tax=Azonexus hydrophilus TaxID=418702 RepID=UPI00248FDA3B|nr:addiction module protein [Azonexus hydrophilus]
MSYEEILEVAMTLSPSERLDLAELLWVSVDNPDEVANTWLEEAERRGEALERGEMEAVDADEVFASLRVKLAAWRKANENTPPS